jgi:hypothetical protein
MEITLRQGEEFPKSTGMPNDSEHCPVRTVTSESAAAPVARIAREINLADDALSDEMRCICFDNLSDELMSGCSAKTVVAPLQFDVGVADAADQQPDGCKSFGSPRLCGFANRNAAIFEMNGDHCRFILSVRGRSAF